MAEQEKPKSVFLSLLKEQAVKDGKLKAETAPQAEAKAQSTTPSDEEVRKQLNRVIEMFGGDGDNPSFESFAFNAQVEGAIEQNGKDFDALLPAILDNKDLVEVLRKNLPSLTHAELEKFRKPTEEQLAAFREEIASLAVLNQLPSHKEAYINKLTSNYNKTDDLSLLVIMKLGQLACLVFTKASHEDKLVLGYVSNLLNEKIETVVSGVAPTNKAPASSSAKEMMAQARSKYANESKPANYSEGVLSFSGMAEPILNKIKAQIEDEESRQVSREAYDGYLTNESIITNLKQRFGEIGTEIINTIVSDRDTYFDYFANEVGTFLELINHFRNPVLPIKQIIMLDRQETYEEADPYELMVRLIALLGLGIVFFSRDDQHNEEKEDELELHNELCQLILAKLSERIDQSS